MIDTLNHPQDTVRCTTLQFLLDSVQQEALRPFALRQVSSIAGIVRVVVVGER